jgi:hypothetical protein
MSNQFSIFGWSDSIPFCDELWLGMQARNIALVDLGILRPMEGDAVSAYFERERTPSDILMPLSALSQMWVFSLYEFLRTWRQRADYLLKLHQEFNEIPGPDRDAFAKRAAIKLEEKRKFVKIGPQMHAEHLDRFQDEEFVDSVRQYRARSESLFREAEALRVTLAKHEVPKTQGMFAESPGYGRMDQSNGSIYWFIALKDGSLTKVDRRTLGDSFLGFDSDNDL